MSSYYAKTMLGIDETKPIPFADSAVEVLARDIEEKVRGYRPGMSIFDSIAVFGVDLVNPYSPKIMGFLQSVLNTERRLQQTLTRSNEGEFRDRVHEAHPDYRDEYVSDFLRAWHDLSAAGRIPSAILIPWNYVPSTIAQDAGRIVGEVAGAAAGSAAPGLQKAGVNVPLLVFGAIAVYAGVTVFLPKMLTGRK